MTYKEMKAFAIYLTTDMSTQDRRVVRRKCRDVYYNPIKKIFAHRPSNRNLKYAATFVDGKPAPAWINDACVFVGRYEVDVNPEWIIEDMRSVQ